MTSPKEKPDIQIIDLTPENIADYGVCGYKDVKKQVELRKKIDWFTEYYPKGLRIKALISNPGGYQGMIEYMPGEIAHRPVNASNYLFIQCVFVGFKKEFKGKGFATQLLNVCIREAREKSYLGLAVVTRAGSFMAKKELFLKNGFQAVDRAKPDFELLVLKFSEESANPAFMPVIKEELTKYDHGLVVMRSPQCPYTEKNVNAILETAKYNFNLKTRLVELKDTDSVQNSPCAFGCFGIIFNGEIIAYHPISKTRFENIIKMKLKKTG